MKYFFTTLLIFASLSVGARDYLPVLTEGKVWNCIFFCGFNEQKAYGFQIKVDGDTIVGNRTCKRIRVEYPKTSEYMMYQSYTTAAYEENHKVYAFKYSDDSETLLMDFNMKKGDVLYESASVFDDDSVEIDGIKRKRILLDESGCNCWIEGIGATSEVWATLVPMPTNGVSQYMESCYENGKCIFKNENLPDFVVSGIKNVDMPKNIGNKNEVYNIMGCKVTDESSHGVFIKNGKKIIR